MATPPKSLFELVTPGDSSYHLVFFRSNRG
jgi:hypothetical protein